MTQLTVTAKGQITLRKEVLQHLGVRPGDRVEVDMKPNGRIEIVLPERTGHISDVFGMLKAPPGTHLTTDDINEATAAGWAGER